MTWAQALEDDALVARQALGKLLAGAPVYVVPGAENRTWHFVGLASYEGALRGAVRPGYIATYAEDDANPYPIADRGAAPEVVRRALFESAAFQGGAPLPKAIFEGGAFTPPRRADGTVDDEALAQLMVPAWARPRSDRKRPPIAGGSDAEFKFNEGTVKSGPPM
jgi:hypothetical protein